MLSKNILQLLLLTWQQGIAPKVDHLLNGITCFKLIKIETRDITLWNESSETDAGRSRNEKEAWWEFATEVAINEDNWEVGRNLNNTCKQENGGIVCDEWMMKCGVALEMNVSR